MQPDFPLRHPKEDGSLSLLHLLVSQTARDQPLGLFLIKCNPFALPKRLPFPGKTEPGEGIENLLFKLGLGTLPVGIFNPKEKPALLITGIKKVEEGRAGAAYMKGAGRGGSKTGGNQIKIFSFPRPSQSIRRPGKDPKVF